MRITGPSGDLDTVWQRRPHAYLGMSVAGFPNFFLMYGPNTNLGSGSIIHMLESQMTHITTAAALVPHGGRIELRADALREFDAVTQRRLATTVWNTGGCDSWYLSDGADGAPVNTNNWPGSMTGYRRRTRRVDLTHYQLTAPQRDADD